MVRACRTLDWIRRGMRKMRTGSGGNRGEEKIGDSAPGIVVSDMPTGQSSGEEGPRIVSFIWGGKVRPTPTLPYGRWKGAA